MTVRKNEVQFDVLQDGEYHKGFWQRVSEGRWEPRTFDALDKHLDAETTFVDVGAWIGPTTLYAARKAKRVLAFEPDPVAFEKLQGNMQANPDIQNVELFNACVAVASEPVRIGFRKHPGDSESSILLGDRGGHEVASVRLQEVLEERRVRDPLFVKMDIEGYEFELIPEVSDFLSSREAVIHLSTHPQILLEDLAQGNGVWSEARKRWRLFSATSRMAWALRRFAYVLDHRDQAVSLMASVLRGGVTGRGFPSDITLISQL